MAVVNWTPATNVRKERPVHQHSLVLLAKLQRRVWDGPAVIPLTSYLIGQRL